MTLQDSSNSILSRNFLSSFRFKFRSLRSPRTKSTFVEHPPATQDDRFIPRQPHNPAIHPLLAKPMAREENFVLLPMRNGSIKRKRDPTSPVRSNVKPKAREEGLTEWERYLTSYAEGRFNMSNPPEPPEKRPQGHMKAPIPSNDQERVQNLREYYDVIRPTDPSSPTSPTTRAQIDRFQRLVITARHTFKTKIVLLSLVDEKRQFFKCETGLGMNIETDREITFCGHTILSNEPMVVLDAKKDWRLAENPLVTGWPYIRFYAGAPIITPKGHAIGTVCLIDTDPRESFDVNQRRKLTEFARLAMDEIELAMKERALKAAQTSKDRLRTGQEDPHHQVPEGLRGMTAVASEAGTIDASIAGKDIKKAVEGVLDEMDVVESNITLADKQGAGTQVKFRYGRNNTPEIEAGVKGVEKARRKVGEGVTRNRSVRVVSPDTMERQSESRRGKTHEGYTAPVVDLGKERDTFASDVATVGSSSRPGTRTSEQQKPSTVSDEVIQQLDIPEPESSRQPPEDAIPPPPKPLEKLKAQADLVATPPMPTFLDVQTKSNPELAAQLIARSLRVDFVYFMRLTPITAKSPNTTGYPDAEVNLELLGCYGLPFPTISFSPFTHLEALRSELGMLYYSAVSESDSESLSNAEDVFKVGIIVPVWREYPRSSFPQSISSATEGGDDSVSGRKSVGASSATSTTIAHLREGCKKGVVVGAFSKRGDRKTFTKIEREYLKEWVALRDHL